MFTSLLCFDNKGEFWCFHFELIVQYVFELQSQDYQLADPASEAFISNMLGRSFDSNDCNIVVQPATERVMNDLLTQFGSLKIGLT